MKKNKISIFLSFCLLLTTVSVCSNDAFGQKKSQLKQAAKLKSEGDASLRQKDYRAAIGKYAAAIAIVPSFSEAHFAKGGAHIQLNENEQAIAEMDAALAGGYKPLDVYRVRWRLYFDRKNYDAALQDARKGLEFEPKNFDYYRAIGEIELAKNSFQTALDTFQKIAQSNPNDADVHYFIAASFAGLKNTEKQIAAAEQAVSRNTKYAGESYFLIAEAHRTNKNYAAAGEFYRKAISAKPGVHIAAYQNLSDIYRRQNLFNEAVETTKKGLENFPDNADLQIDLGHYYSLADRNAEAIVAAEQAVKLLPENYAGYATLCRVYYETKQFQQARQVCETALKLNSNDGATSVYAGFTSLSLNRDDIAKDFFKKATVQLLEYTRANPDYFDGFYLLGNSFYYAEQPQRAIQAYLKTLELNPKFTRARFNLGLAYFVNKNLPAAREQYNALLKTNRDLADKLLAIINKK